MTALAMTPVMTLISPSPAAAETTLNPSQFKGLVWSRIEGSNGNGDNFTYDRLLLQGLSASDDYAQTKAKSLEMIQAFKNVGANTIRIPVNPATATEPYWSKYRGVIDAAIEKGVKVDLSYWTEDGSGRVPNPTTWNAMWDTVTTAYLSEPLIHFNPIQEATYDDASFLDLMAKWLDDRPQVPRNRVFLAGVNANSDVRPLCYDNKGPGGTNRLEGTYLVLHQYFFDPRVPQGADYDRWVADLMGKIGTCASRVVMEEFGSDMNTGLDYNDRDSTDRLNLFWRAYTDTVRRLGLGAIYCHGIGGRNLAGDTHGRYDPLNIVRLKSTSENLPLWVPNPAGLQRLQYAWGMGPTERVEGETATLLGGARIESQASASGGQDIGYLDHTGDGVTFTNLSAVNRFDIGYATPTPGTLSLYINGVKNQTLSFPATGAWGKFVNKGINVTIPAGATVTLKRDTGDSAINIDYLNEVPNVRVEGETGTLLGNAKFEPHSNASNGQNVGFMATTGDGVSFTNLHSTNKIDIGYAAADTGTFSLYVNGAKDQTITFPATGGWNTFAKKTVNVTVPLRATVTLKRDPGDMTMNVDYIDHIPSVRYEAEMGTLLGNASVGNYYASASGGLNVGATFNVGDGVSISNLNAANRIVIGYATNANSTFSLYINDVKNQTITFPATGWGNFTKKAVNVTIPAGAKISLKHDTGDGTIDIDYIDQ